MPAQTRSKGQDGPAQTQAQSQATPVQTQAQGYNTPPCEKKWYEDFFQDARAGKMHHDDTGVKRMVAGMGLSDNERDAIMQKATELIPADQILSIVSTAGRRIKEEAAERLSVDDRFGSFFVRNFSDYHALANQFFAEAPGRWIACANNKRREEQARQNASTNTGAANPPGPVDGDVDMTDDQVSDEEGRENSQAEESAGRSNSPMPTSQPTRILMPNMLEIKTIRARQFDAVCMNDLFNTGEITPLPSEITFESIRTYWVDHIRARTDLEVRFKFFFFGDATSADREVTVSNDANLRYAYRLWLRLGDVEMPMVLFVKDAAGN